MSPRLPFFLATLLLLATSAPPVAAQDPPPPETDVYLVSLEGFSDDLRLGEARNLTDRRGYDNQPTFLPDGEALVYTAIGDDGQADIHLYDLEKGTSRVLVKTPESEYSPTPVPGEASISVVRVEADGRQRLWKLPLGGGEAELLLPGLEPVGYHAWGDEARLALFVLGEPHTLHRADLGGGPAEQVTGNIGRALKRAPGTAAVTFVHKALDDAGKEASPEGSGGGGDASDGETGEGDESELPPPTWWIKNLHFDSGKVRPLAPTLPGREDFAWSPSGELWMGDGSRLFRWRPGEDSSWREVGDLAAAGITEITRLAFHPEESALAIAAVPLRGPARIAGVAETPARIAKLFSAWDTQAEPGCTLGVAVGGELVHAEGYGLANLEHEIPLESASVFRIASTSKQFTALSVLLLAEDGLLELDDDIRTYLPELPDYGTPVTLRHLLHHTSGYRDYLTLQRLAGLRRGSVYDAEEVLDLLSRQRKLNFSAGSAFTYSNSGYFLLGQIVERVSGESLRQLADRRIFAPLGMTASRFNDDTSELVPGRAVGYAPDQADSFRIATTRLDIVGDGGVFTSVEDLLLWVRNFSEPKVGSAETLELMGTPGQLQDGEPIDYGFGLRIGEYHDLRFISHGGAFAGYRAQLLRFPDQELAVMCLCNRADARATEIAFLTAEIYLEDFLPQAEDDGDQDGDDPDPDDDQASDDQASDDQGPDDAASPDPPAEAEDETEEQESESAEESAAIEAENTAANEDRVAEQTVAEPEDLAAFIGLYRCEEIGRDVELFLGGEGNLRFRHAGPGWQPAPLDLERAAPDAFNAGVLTFDFTRSASGRAESFSFGARRVRGLHCQRAVD